MPDNEKVPLAGLDALLSDAGALQGVGQGVGPLARLQPILAWELREAINAAIGHRPDGKILAYLARVIENVRKEKRTPAPRPAEGETDDERRKRIRAQQRREQEELEAYMAKAVPCPPELRLGAPSPGGSTPGGG